MGARAKRLDFRSRQAGRTVDDDEIESSLHDVRMKNFRERISHVGRSQQVALQTFHQGMTQICGPEMDALKQPLDHDTIVSLRKIIVRRDDLQSARAIFIGAKINLLSEKRYVERRDIDADVPRGQRAPMHCGQPVTSLK